MPHNFFRAIAALMTAIATPAIGAQASMPAGSTPVRSTVVTQPTPQPSVPRTAPPPVLPNPYGRPPLHPPKGPGGGSDQPDQFTALTFIVKTGGDDLRSWSNTWIDFTFADHSVLTCTLKDKNRDGWDNGSTHRDDIPVCVLPSPMTLEQIKSAGIVLNYHSFAADFQTDDNWNVDWVHIDATNSAAHSSTCLIDEAGDPLHRFQNIFKPWDFYAGVPSDSFDLGHHPSTC